MINVNDLSKIVFVDCEVFYRDALVVFYNYDLTEYRIWHNDFHGIEEFVKDKVLVTYNGEWYDNHIITAMINGNSPKQIKELNDRIIGGEKIRQKFRKFKSIDLFQQISVNFPSLKKIEGNNGVKILESSVDFNIERHLTPSELEEVIEYCKYDVKMLRPIFDMRKDNYLVPKMELVKLLNNENAAYWNSTTLSANLLTKKPVTKWSNIRVPEELLDIVPPEVKEMWLTKDKGNITTEEFDNDIVWGFGGLHGTHKHKKRFENVVLLDVALT